jgi:hypothetical protein
MSRAAARGAAAPIPGEVRNALIRRVLAITEGYRSVAQQMGQLYMYADEHALEALTRSLDQPMRTAAENERVLAAILDELQLDPPSAPRKGRP